MYISTDSKNVLKQNVLPIKRPKKETFIGKFIIGLGGQPADQFLYVTQFAVYEQFL